MDCKQMETRSQCENISSLFVIYEFIMSWKNKTVYALSWCLYAISCAHEQFHYTTYIVLFIFSYHSYVNAHLDLKNDVQQLSNHNSLQRFYIKE